MIAILGGGITGLVAAYYLKRNNVDFILLEASDRLGGKIQTKKKDGFTCELGPNTVLINNLATKELLEDLDLWDELVFPDDLAVKKRFVLKNGVPQAIPTSFKSALKSELVGLKTLKAILFEPFKAKGSLPDESLADFARRRFGDHLYQDFITPFVTGIYAGNPEKMSINFVLSILKDAEQRKGSVLLGMAEIMKEKKRINEHHNLPKQKIFSFREGLGFLIKRLEEEVKTQLSLQSRVSAISREGSDYLIHYRSQEENKSVRVNKVISTVPANGLQMMVKELNPSLSQALTKINYVPAVMVHLGFKKGVIQFEEKAFGILSRQSEKVPFLGILFNSKFFPHTSKSSEELITVICGGYRNPAIVKKTEPQILAEVLLSLEQVLKISQKPIFHSITKWEKGIPQYELGYDVIEKTIKAFEQTEQNFHLGGNFYQGISVSDCINNGKQLAKKTLN